jgi:CheY-like chemotaxis protein
VTSVRDECKFVSQLLVALSGYALPEDVERAFVAGFDQHLAKPPDLNELEQVFAAGAAPGSRRGSVSSNSGPGSVG